MRMQTVVRALYPPQCVGCAALTTEDFGLCGACWRETPFISGLVCDCCGAPLPGHDDGLAVHCDDCLATPRPWAHGRAALRYEGTARRLVLALKHGDRTDLAQAAGRWMAQASGPLLRDDMLVVPVPLHWTRLLRRRFNQAALLARVVGGVTRMEVMPDLLVRSRRTHLLEGLGRDARFAMLDAAIYPHPKRGVQAAGRPVLLIDDVMTSGATLAAAAEAAQAAGATEVCVLTLARVCKDT
ncbi:MAG: ComF family protein [Limimaricola sp.]|uniref:ComF family protein n=1 Tax=Limimaricola sp. TaxID=2211665 RepID=UPI001DD025EF|nr:ComF family protein [Limimaricola sp.]MBI1417191.1 ComF family protein [Limimaricola sp.]